MMAYDPYNEDVGRGSIPGQPQETAALGQGAQSAGPVAGGAYTCLPLRPMTPPKAMRVPTRPDAPCAGADRDSDPYAATQAGYPAANQPMPNPPRMEARALAAAAVAQPLPPEGPNGQSEWAQPSAQDIARAVQPAPARSRQRPSACNACNMPAQEPLGTQPQWGTVAGSESFLPPFAKDSSVAAPGSLTADQYAAALGSPNAGDVGIATDVADAFARAWAADGDVLHYRGDMPDEETATHVRNTGGVVSWQPMTAEQLLMQRQAFAAEGLASMRGEPDDKLFKAYGGSYAEAYAVARSLQFHEQRPLPDDGTGDIAGMVESILHTPSGEPIRLGSVMIQTTPDEIQDEEADPATPSEKPLPTGRRIARACLLTLGAAALAVAGLYFAGMIP